MSDWYYHDQQGAKGGPVTWDEIRSLYQSGVLSLDSLVMHAKRTDGAWRPLRELKDGDKSPQFLGKLKQRHDPRSLQSRVNERWYDAASRRRSLKFFCGVGMFFGFVGALGTMLGAVNAAAGAVMFVGSLILLVLSSMAATVGDIQLAVVTMETLANEDRERRARENEGDDGESI